MRNASKAAALPKKSRTLGSRAKSVAVDSVWAIAGIFVVLLAWQLIVMLTEAKRVMPSPVTVLEVFFRSFREPIGRYLLPQHLLFSLTRVLVGYLTASVLGIIVGIIMGISRLGSAIIKPVFHMLRPIPPIAWIPLAILWLGIGEVTKYFIIFIGAFTLVTTNACTGAMSTDPQLVGAARMLGANRAQIFWRVVLPSALPQIFSGLQVALSTSWMAVLTAEMVRSSEGAGWVIIMGSENGNTVQILVGMIAIALVGLLLTTAMRFLERRLCSWNVRGR